MIVTGGDELKEVGVEREVKQGFYLSSMLFNIYVEKLTEKTLEKARGCNVMRGERIKPLNNADDQVILAELEEELQCMVQSILLGKKDFGMKVHVGKAKVMRIIRN